MLGDERHTRSGGACGKNWPSGAKPILHHNAADYSPGADSNLKCNTCNQVRFADVITSFVLVLSTTSA